MLTIAQEFLRGVGGGGHDRNRKASMQHLPPKILGSPDEPPSDIFFGENISNFMNTWFMYMTQGVVF